MIDIRKITTDRDCLEIEQLYKKFLAVPLYSDDTLAQDFTNYYNETIFPKGTSKNEVLDWFNDIYPEGIDNLKEKSSS